MKARDIMTRKVVSVTPDTPAREIAALLLKKRVSAVPVVDANGVAVGIVSKGDLIGKELEYEARRDWWLTVLAEGEAVNSDFLANLRSMNRVARDLMSSPVIVVAEEADVTEIARTLVAHNINRIPVVGNGRMVVIVSRGDILRALIVV